MTKERKIKIIAIFAIFLLTFPFHFMYEWFPNKATAIFFPVNESIWEHMKLIFTATAVWSILELLLIKKLQLHFHNIASNFVITSLFNIILFLTLYLPIHHFFGEILPVTLVLLFLTITISQIFSYFLLSRKENKKIELVFLILIPLVITGFGYLTYHPIKNDLFLDFQSQKYSISTLVQEK